MQTSHATQNGGKKYHLHVHAIHLLRNECTKLYSSVGQPLMELIKNGAAAAMPDSEWKPKLANIQIRLEKGHPLAHSDGWVLIVHDNGCGLNDTRLERFLSDLGRDKKKSGGSHHVVSQKGIGRFAGWYLNDQCHDKNDDEAIKHGYYVLTRTAAEGKVRFFKVAPNMYDDGGIDPNFFVLPSAPEMGSFKNYRGSFTEIVIPSPVFKSAQEIEDAIKWLLPRTKDRMFGLTINGKSISPPPLETDVSHTFTEDSRFMAYLGKADTPGEGPWLADEATGFRVARCVSHSSKLPAILCSAELTGEIFVPDLIWHQNSARDQLATEFMKSKNPHPTWSKLLTFLGKELAPLANALVDRGKVRNSDASKTLDEVLKILSSKWGAPTERYEGEGEGGTGGGYKRPKNPNPTERGPYKPRQTENDGGNGNGNGNGTGTKKPVMEAFRLRGETYFLKKDVPLAPNMFAQIDYSEPNVIIVNVKGGMYAAMPKRAEERTEHCLYQLLLAVSVKHNLHQPEMIVPEANDMRKELLSK